MLDSTMVVRREAMSAFLEALHCENVVVVVSHCYAGAKLGIRPLENNLDGSERSNPKRSKRKEFRIHIIS
jgi:hypothetical protein